MFFFLFAKSFCDENEEDDEEEMLPCKRTFSISGFNTPENNFLSKKLPGLHYDFIGNETELESIFECTSLLSTNLTEENLSEITRETKIFTKESADEWEKFKGDSSFVYLRIDGVRSRMKIYPNFSEKRIFQQENNLSESTPCVYTHFDIMIHESPKKCGVFDFNVKSTNISAIEEGKSITFSFSIERSPIVPILKSRGNKNVGYLGAGLFALLFLSAAFMSSLLMLKKRNTNAIQYSDIWRPHQIFKITVKFAILGFSVLCYILMLYFGRSDLHYYDDYAIQSLIMGTFFPNIVMCVVGTIFSVDFSFSDNIFLFLHMFLLVVLPHQVITYVNRFMTGAWRGLGIVSFILTDAILIITELVSTNAAMSTGKLLRLPFKIESNHENGTWPKEKFNIVKLVVDLLYVVGISFFTKPFIHHLVNCFVFGDSFNGYIIVGGLLIIFGFCGSLGIFSSTMRIKQKEPASWINGHFQRAVVSYFIILILIIVMRIKDVHQTMPIVYLAFYSTVISLAVSSLGLLASFFASIFVMLVSFAQQKIN